MSKELIKGIVFTDFDPQLGPNPILWVPSDLSENIRMSVSIKAITILTADQGIMPTSLIIMPFPSINLKGIIKYIEKEDEIRRGGVIQSSITLLFDEIDDIVFYKYLSYLEPIFNETSQRIIDTVDLLTNREGIMSEIKNLQMNILNLLEDLRIKEEELTKREAFPEKSIEDDGILKYKFKIILCGDPGVGKTSTILKFTDNAFRTSYISTIGTSISEKIVKINGKSVGFILWDLAGQVKFDAMRKHFYKGAEAGLLVFDLTKPESLKSIPNWYKDLIKSTERIGKIPIFILGNKNDLINERKVEKQEAEFIAKELNLDYFETSALTGENINHVFEKIAHILTSRKS
jgi:small GTP-binding protein